MSHDSMLAVLLSFICVLISLYYYKQKSKYYKCLRAYPGPPAVPFIGNVFKYMPATDILNTITKQFNTYGPVVTMWAGFVVPIQITLITMDIKLVEFVLSSTRILDKPLSYRFLKNWLKTGLLTAGGKKWRQRRRIINPTFHIQILEQFVDVFNKQSDILIEKLKKEMGKSSTEIGRPITLCTLDTICESVMGTSINAQSKEDSEYVHSVDEMCRIIIARTFSLNKLFDFTYKFTEDYHKEQKALKILHDYTDSVIKSRREELLKIETMAEANEDIGTKKRQVFLDLILQLTIDGKPFDDEDITEEVATFMFAGHDTTATGITFTLFCLANNAEIQQKVIDEQISVVGNDKNKPVTFQELQEMKYLELVIKEGLRLYPSVPTFARTISEDIVYEGTLLPKGLDVYISPYQIHRNPEIYPDPEKFDPERFLPENCVGRPTYAYIPFSAGPRNCIGQKFAILEMKAIISKILRNFKLEPAIPKHELELMSETVLKSKNGVRVHLKKRNLTE